MVKKLSGKQCIYGMWCAILVAFAWRLWAQTDAGGATDQGAVLISTMHAVLLGVVEGITEYLPISSTGHLILVDHFIGVRTGLSEGQMNAIDAFEIVIQSGAILAVVFAFHEKVKEAFLGLLGKSQNGRKLFFNLIAGFIPAAVVGLLFHKMIKNYLQSEWPVVIALAVGGIAMIAFDRSEMFERRRRSGKQVEHLTVMDAIKIGFMQCLAMWPGTSRSMVTILGGMVVGLTPAASAEFSFLLGVPTLLAASAFKALKHGKELVQYIGFDAMGIGLVVAALFAFLAVKGLIKFLTKNGLAPFGWYRLILSGIVGYLLLSS
jgi:undecaprenyl-diphosphatase